MDYSFCKVLYISLYFLLLDGEQGKAILCLVSLCGKEEDFSLECKHIQTPDVALENKCMNPLFSSFL